MVKIEKFKKATAAKKISASKEKIVAPNPKKASK